MKSLQFDRFNFTQETPRTDLKQSEDFFPKISKTKLLKKLPTQNEDKGKRLHDMRSYLLSLDSRLIKVCETEIRVLKTRKKQIDIIPIYKHSNRDSMSHYSQLLRETNDSSERLPRILRI